jgi:hypothetical protein
MMERAAAVEVTARTDRTDLRIIVVNSSVISDSGRVVFQLLFQFPVPRVPVDVLVDA